MSEEKKEFEQLIDEVFEFCLEQAIIRNPKFELDYEDVEK